jgi:hypothetical protein
VSQPWRPALVAPLPGKSGRPNMRAPRAQALSGAQERTLRLPAMLPARLYESAPEWHEPGALQGASDSGTSGCLDGAALSGKAQGNVAEDLPPVAGAFGRIVVGGHEGRAWAATRLIGGNEYATDLLKRQSRSARRSRSADLEQPATPRSGSSNPASDTAENLQSRVLRGSAAFPDRPLSWLPSERRQASARLPKPPGSRRVVMSSGLRRIRDIGKPSRKRSRKLPTHYKAKRSNRAVHEWLAPVFHRPPVRRPPHHDNRMFKVLLKAWKTEKYR